MRKVSSESLFHHTNKLSTLENIVNSMSFKVSYSTERIYVNNNHCFNILVPMVSFCNIPLTQYLDTFKARKKHEQSKILGYYGDYGIAMSMDWAKRHQLLPVFYLPKPKKEDITPFHPLYSLYSRANNSVNKDMFGEKLEPELQNSILRYVKHFEGYICRNDDTTPRYHKFYDEREWRYVNGTLLWNFTNNKIESANDKSKKKEKSKNLNEKLCFKKEDVVLIILHRDDEIDKFLNNIRDLDVCNYLRTRIITIQRVLDDM